VLDPVSEAAEAAGVTVSRTPIDEARPRTHVPILHRQAHLVSERWAHACARIFRILEGAGKCGAITTASSVRDAEMPILANEYMRAFKLYTWLRYVDADWNPYRGMNESDAAKKFMRVVADICDRSTGRMGPWY
jgi:hypothetical protein